MRVLRPKAGLKVAGREAMREAVRGAARAAARRENIVTICIIVLRCVFVREERVGLG